MKRLLSLALVPTLLLLQSCSGMRFGKKLDFVFESGTDGYQCFRIPATVVTPDGSLLAFAEGRNNGCSDSGDIDLVLKKSVDGGTTWGPMEVVWSDGNNTVGNPAPVVDQETGTVFLLVTRNLGTDHEPDIIAGESEDTRRIFVLSSDDNGESWTPPREITNQVKSPNWTWYATGPGSGIQLRTGIHAGRLMVACDHIEAETRRYFSHVIYSDDHGATWHLGGTTPQDQVNESEVAELPDGSLLLNMRNYAPGERHRKISRSTDGGLTWHDLQSDSTLIEPICQASLHQAADITKGETLLLFSNPASKEKRENMTIRASSDNGVTWDNSFVVYNGPSAYSDLVQLDTGTAGILFEAGYTFDQPYRGIIFNRYKIDEILP